MAWGSIGLVGNLGTTAATTVLAIAATIATVANNVLVLTAAQVNSSADQETSEISGVVDTGNNHWVKVREWSGGTAGTGAACAVWVSHLTNAISSGAGAITVNLSAATTRRAAGVWAFSVGPGASVRARDSTYITATSAQSPLSIDLATPTTTELLRFRGIASESSLTTALTTSAGWTNIGTTRAGATGAMSYRGEFLITAATTAASNPTLTSTATDASVYVLFEECLLMGTKSL
jgi:hypothetical protein